MMTFLATSNKEDLRIHEVSDEALEAAGGNEVAARYTLANCTAYQSAQADRSDSSNTKKLDATASQNGGAGFFFAISPYRTCLPFRSSTDQSTILLSPPRHPSERRFGAKAVVGGINVAAARDQCQH
jgi:hypothetical protein